MTTTNTTTDCSEFHAVRISLLSAAAMLMSKGAEEKTVLAAMGAAYGELIGLTIRNEKIAEVIDDMVPLLKETAHAASAAAELVINNPTRN